MKLGVVGTGKIVEEALTVFEKIKDYELYGICSTPRSREKGMALKEQYQMQFAVTDYEELLASEAEVIYIAVPNHLHASFAKQAIAAGKHVIVEKPVAMRLQEMEEIQQLLQEKKVFYFEAITTIYLPHYKKTKELLQSIGKIKIAECSFCQYSSRYDAFVNGELPPVFDPEKAGGALMDINVYNLHYLTGLFGEPESITYQPNMERGVDTSGVLTLQYKDFVATAVGAKDCSGPCGCVLHGTNGYVEQKVPANSTGKVLLQVNEKEPVVYDLDGEGHRMEAEYKRFAAIIKEKDDQAAAKGFAHSKLVVKLLEQARP